MLHNPSTVLANPSAQTIIRRRFPIVAMAMEHWHFVLVQSPPSSSFPGKLFGLRGSRTADIVGRESEGRGLLEFEEGLFCDDAKRASGARREKR